MNYPTGVRFEKQIRFMYKWLPIFCGCHQRPERSFFVKGYQMPVCARCEGELIGILAALIAVWFLRPSYWLMAVMMGFGITMIVIMFLISVFKMGVLVGSGLRG